MERSVGTVAKAGEVVYSSSTSPIGVSRVDEEEDELLLLDDMMIGRVQ